MMLRLGAAIGIGVFGFACACSQGPSLDPSPGPNPGDPPQSSPDAGPVDPPQPTAIEFTAMTMNIGTSKDGDYGDPGPDGYGDDDSAFTKEYYGNGLSWSVAEAALTEFLATERPAVVVFQEGFFDGWCADIPDVGPKFVCHGYTPSRPLQVERLLGPDYQVACARDEPDNCAGVRKDFATIRGCPLNEPCMDGLDGPDAPDGCSDGARVGGMTLDLADGRELRVVNVHAKSGGNIDDMLCRVTHFEQIFEDGGDGHPIANGPVNLVMGDINTDPFLAGFLDPSAEYWNDWVGGGGPYFYMSSDKDDDDAATYAYGLRVDHIVSDTLVSKGCKVPGSGGEPSVLDQKFWDHNPVLCRVEMAP